MTTAEKTRKTSAEVCEWAKSIADSVLESDLFEDYGASASFSAVQPNIVVIYIDDHALMRAGVAHTIQTHFSITELENDDSGDDDTLVRNRVWESMRRGVAVSLDSNERSWDTFIKYTSPFDPKRDAWDGWIEGIAKQSLLGRIDNNTMQCCVQRCPKHYNVFGIFVDDFTNLESHLAASPSGSNAVTIQELLMRPHEDRVRLIAERTLVAHRDMTPTGPLDEINVEIKDAT